MKKTQPLHDHLFDIAAALFEQANRRRGVYNHDRLYRVKTRQRAKHVYRTAAVLVPDAET